MKKLTRALGMSMLVMASLCTAGNNTYAKGISLIINEVPVTGSVMPIMVDNRTLAPVRVISETLGAKVDFDKATKKITITKGVSKIEMTVGKPQVKVNGVTQVMDSVPIVKNGSTMLPLRFIGEVLDCQVSWDKASQTVKVTSSDAPAQKPTDKNVDKWGRKIRTTNLPKNASLFPYIVEGVPNWVYEAIRINKPTEQWETEIGQNTDLTAKQMWDKGKFDYDYWVKNLERDLMTRLNIDYRTINKDEFYKVMNELYDSDKMPKEYGSTRATSDAYVDFVKQHKIVSKAEVTVLPETFWKSAFDTPVVNAYVKLTVIQQPDKSTNLVFDDFGAMYRGGKAQRPIEGKVYEGVVQICLTGGNPQYYINYNKSDVRCQLVENIFGGARQKDQATITIK